MWGGWGCLGPSREMDFHTNLDHSYYQIGEENIWKAKEIINNNHFKSFMIKSAWKELQLLDKSFLGVLHLRQI